MTWRDVVDVDAARGDVGGDQHAGRAVAEVVERPLAGVLRLVAVDGVGARCRPCRGARTTRSAPCLVRVKTMHAAHRRIVEEMRSAARASLAWSTRIDVLVDAVDRGRGRRRPRRAPGSRRISSPSLARSRPAWWPRTAATGARCGSLRDDPPDVADEAHVEHAVGFVEDEDLDTCRGATLRCSMRSSRRPGVATRMSTPSRRALTCGPGRRRRRPRRSVSCRWRP